MKTEKINIKDKKNFKSEKKNDYLQNAGLTQRDIVKQHGLYYARYKQFYFSYAKIKKEKNKKLIIFQK